MSRKKKKVKCSKSLTNKLDIKISDISSNDIEEYLDLGLLLNGFDFVLSGIEYVVNDSNPSNKKFAILHLSAGIDIVFKAFLRDFDWTQLYRDTSKADEPSFKSGEFIGVDSGELRRRLKSECLVVFTKKQEKVLKLLRRKRNLIEHYRLKDSVSSLKTLFADSLSVLIDFITENILKEGHPLTEDQRSMLECLKNKSLGFGEYITKRNQKISNKLIGKCVVECPSCRQKALVIDNDTLICEFCGYMDPDGFDFIDDYLLNILEVTKYMCQKQEQTYPVFDCIDGCGGRMIEGKENFFCINCGSIFKNEDVVFCSECNEPYRRLEMNCDLPDPMCDYCYSELEARFE